MDIPKLLDLDLLDLLPVNQIQPTLAQGAEVFCLDAKQNNRHSPQNTEHIMKLTIIRESEQIFFATSDAPFWSDGQPIREYVAFNSAGILSNTTAQSINRKLGNHYILVSPFSIKNPVVISAAKNMAVGDMFIYNPAN